MLYWLANTNFFGRPTFIRKIQCDVFGHCWFATTLTKDLPKYKNWCGWCGREVGPYPKMRERKV